MACSSTERPTIPPGNLRKHKTRYTTTFTLFRALVGAFRQLGSLVLKAFEFVEILVVGVVVARTREVL